MTGKKPLPTLTLRRRVIRAGSLVIGAHIAGQVLRLASNLVMTRLLVPEMFGIMAVANLLIIGISLFSDIGLQQNIIQSKRGHEPDYLNAVWTVQIIRGVLIWLLVLGMILILNHANRTGWFDTSSVYASQDLPSVLYVISLTALLGGFNSTKLATARRNLDMGKVIRLNVLTQIGGLMVMIAWALLQKSIWALAAGAVASAVLQLLLSHLLLPGVRNRLHWNVEIFSEIFHFGKWIFLTSILGFLAINGDRLMLGGMIDAKSMGLFTIAFFMANAIREVISMAITSAVYPALSEVVRERPADMKKVYYKLRKPIGAAVFFSAGILFTSGHILIDFFYDERYQDAGWMLEILSIGLLQLPYTLAAQCFLAMGKPKFLVPVTLTRAVGLFILLPLAFYFYGLRGAIWVAGAAALLEIPVLIGLKIRSDLIVLREEVYSIPWLFSGLALGYAIAACV